MVFDPDSPSPLGSFFDPDRPSPLGRASPSLGRAKYAAELLSRTLLLTAQGESTAGSEPQFVQTPFLIDPPQFSFLLAPPKGINTGQMLPFRYTQKFQNFPAGANVVVIYDALGSQVVEISKPRSVQLTTAFDGGATQVGISPISLEDALNTAILDFEQAQAGGTADEEFVYSVVHSGKMKGGISGRDVFFAEVNRIAASK